MNAIPQRKAPYKRASIPQTPAEKRQGARIEHLEGSRAQKLAVRKKELEMRRIQYEREMARRREMERLAEIDKLYNPVRQEPKQQPRQVQKQPKKAKSKKGMKWSVGGKKLAAALAAMSRPTTQKKQVKKKTKGVQYQVSASGSIALRRTAIPGFDMYADAPPAAAKAYKKQVDAAGMAKSRRDVVSTIVTIVLVFVMLSAVLSMYAAQSQAVHNNSVMEKEIELLEKELDKLSKEKASREDLNSIQNAARKLGMHYPQDDQIVYLPPYNEAEVMSVAEAQQLAEAEGVQSGDELTPEQVDELLAGAVEKLDSKISSNSE